MRSERARIAGLALVVAALLGGAGCGTEIGDACQSDFSCGAGNICDLTAPEGYCTRTPCRTFGCEGEESLCVEFPNGESYCMRECGGSGDCREGYACMPARPASGAGGACEFEGVAGPGGPLTACAPGRSDASSFCYVP